MVVIIDIVLINHIAINLTEFNLRSLKDCWTTYQTSVLGRYFFLSTYHSFPTVSLIKISKVHYIQYSWSNIFTFAILGFPDEFL